MFIYATCVSQILPAMLTFGYLQMNGALEMIVETILERGSGVGYAVADAGFPRGR